MNRQGTATRLTKVSPRLALPSAAAAAGLQLRLYLDAPPPLLSLCTNNAILNMQGFKRLANTTCGKMLQRDVVACAQETGETTVKALGAHPHFVVKPLVNVNVSELRLLGLQ